MIAPRVHRNGTSRGDLLAAIRDARTSIHAALTALKHTAPHGRDYYVIGPCSYAQAREEFETRLGRLHATNDELIAMYQAIEQNEIEFTTGVK